MKKCLFLILIASLSFIGCQPHGKVLKIAATPVPHTEILEAIKPELEHQGIQLKIVEVDDYNLPNRLLFEKQVDANFFQHKPFLEEQNSRFGYNLIELTAVHIEPLGIYSRTLASLSEVKEGMTVAIPSDPTNESRALDLLADVGLIKMKFHPATQLVTIYDITENPKRLKFEEVDAAFLPHALHDVDMALIPANFALQAGLNPVHDALALESSHSPYANIVAIRSDEVGREDLEKLKAALHSEKMRQFILEKYKGAILPAF